MVDGFLDGERGMVDYRCIVDMYDNVYVRNESSVFRLEN